MSSPRWQAWGRSECGPVRKHNEDAMGLLGSKGPWVVADGMGGHAHGDVASQAVVEVLAQPLEGQEASRLEQLRQRLHQVNTDLYAFAKSQGEEKTGTTVVLAEVQDWAMHVMWAGDSRLYRLRQGQLQLLTQDHTLVAELVRRGQITAEQAETHPYSHVITRAVGSAKQLEIDELQLVIEAGDRFLLCTDGLSNALGFAELGRLWAQTQGPQAAVQQLMEAALPHAKDNLTALALEPIADAG